MILPDRDPRKMTEASRAKMPADLTAEPEFVPGVQAAHLPGNLAAHQFHGGLLLVGMDGEADAGLDADDLVQIEMPEILALVGHGQDGHVGMVAQPELRLAHQHR